MRNPALSRAFVRPKLMTKSGSDAYQARAKLRSKRDRFSSIFLTSGFFLRKPRGSIGSTWFPSVLLQSAQRTQRVNCLSSKICKNQSSYSNHHELKVSSANKKPSENWAARHQLGEWTICWRCTAPSHQSCSPGIWRIAVSLRLDGQSTTPTTPISAYWLSLFLCQTLRIHTCLDVLMYLIRTISHFIKHLQIHCIFSLIYRTSWLVSNGTNFENPSTTVWIHDRNSWNHQVESHSPDLFACMRSKGLPEHSANALGFLVKSDFHCTI